MKRILVATALAAMSVNAFAGSICKGAWYDPINDTDWNNSFPITIGGIKTGDNSDPPLMDMPAICSCPDPLTGSNLPGIGMTYWEPGFVIEIERTPGCSSTMGGVTIVSGYESLSSNQKASEKDGETNNVRMQAHFFNYPLFAVLNVVTGLGCMNLSSFSLDDLTEFDSSWQDDTWSSSAMPAGSLFADLTAVLSCIPDGVASTLGWPLDLLYWCSGTQGLIYPMTGTSQNYSSPNIGNVQLLGKYMARKTEQIGLLATIGPWAKCGSTWLPTWLKSQYRINPIWPVPIKGSPIVFGESEFRWAMLPPANQPDVQSNAFLMWVGKQCCFL